MDRIRGFIRSKSRAEWEGYFSEKISQLREFVRTQGERAALLAFAMGIFLVLFYKLVIVLLCIGLIAHQLILIISDTPKS